MSQQLIEPYMPPMSGPKKALFTILKLHFTPKYLTKQQKESKILNKVITAESLAASNHLDIIQTKVANSQSLLC